VPSLWALEPKQRRLSAKGSRVVSRVITGAALLLLVGCSVPSYRSTETEYPAKLVARVTKRTGVQHSPIPIVTESGEVIRSRGVRIDYELLANDGTLLIVQATSDFPIGACVMLSGYADGPSRTHFSFGRAELKASDRCQ
jgi:hypothetical protein